MSESGGGGGEKDEDLLSLFSRIYNDDAKFLILKVLSEREGANLRELARQVGRSPKSLLKHLKELNDKGVIAHFEASPSIKVYRLSEKSNFLRGFFKRK